MIGRAYQGEAGAQIHYRFAGSDDGPVMVLLHQAPSSSVMFESMMTSMPKNLRLIAPDLPGFGQSDVLAGEVSIAAWAQRISEFLKAVHCRPQLLFGHHTGAAVALQLAYEQPDICDKLALSGPTLLSDAMKQALPAKATAFPLHKDGSHLRGMWERMLAKEVQAPLELVLRETLLGLQLGSRYAEAYTAVIEQDARSQLAALELPVLVFAGRKDPLYPMLHEAHDLLKLGQCRELDDVASYACELRSVEIAALLQDFMTEASPEVLAG